MATAATVSGAMSEKREDGNKNLKENDESRRLTPKNINWGAATEKGSEGTLTHADEEKGRKSTADLLDAYRNSNYTTLHRCNVQTVFSVFFV